MSELTELHSSEDFIAELRDCAKLLSEKLTVDDYEGASKLIQELVEVRDRNMFVHVGKLTRGLHNAIINFNVDASIATQDPADIAIEGIDHKEIQDASDRLNYVINMTQKAADKTMDLVEESSPVAVQLANEAEQLKGEWERLKRREMSGDEFRELYGRMDDFLAASISGSRQINHNLQHIILEQGFQDLTGQVLKRVIGLISDVERDLVSLVRIAGQVEQITGLGETADSLQNDKPEDKIKGEGPQIHADKRDDVVSGQDDVDDLLSSLGF